MIFAIYLLNGWLYTGISQTVVNWSHIEVNINHNYLHKWTHKWAVAISWGTILIKKKWKIIKKHLNSVSSGKDKKKKSWGIN